MTKQRKHALQWFYDHGVAIKELAKPDAPSAVIMGRMERDGQLSLTDKGRCDLWEVVK